MIDWTCEESADNYSVLVFISMQSCSRFIWGWVGEDLKNELDVLAGNGVVGNTTGPRSRHLAVQGSEELHKFVKDTSTTIAQMAAQQSREDGCMTMFNFVKLGVEREWKLAQSEMEEAMGYRV